MARKKRTRRKVARKKRQTRRQSAADLSVVSTDELQLELERREAEVAELQERRDMLIEELNEVDSMIAQYGGAPPRRRRGRPRKVGKRRTRAGAQRGGRRPRNKMNLVDALAQVLRNKTMSVTEVAEAVQRAGYKTNSANFRTIVNQTLISKKDRFRKVARGQYTAK
jgi:hypothetical protein